MFVIVCHKKSLYIVLNPKNNFCKIKNVQIYPFLAEFATCENKPRMYSIHASLTEIDQVISIDLEDNCKIVDHNYAYCRNQTNFEKKIWLK
jgi:hypothetical protein